MKKLCKYAEKIVPFYGIVPVLFSLGFNSLVYTGTKVIAGDWHHYNIETRFDLKIPLIPEFLLIYFGCYLFWAVNYILIARQEKENVYRFFTADLISRGICCVIFLMFPTTNTRPVIASDGFWNQAVLWLYSIDSATNLFPSIHCLVSWFCYLGIRGRKEIPRWYQIFSMLFAFTVFLSTLFVKQHVIVDIFGGVLLAKLCFRIGYHTDLYRYYGKLGDAAEQKILSFVEEKQREKRE